MIDFTEATMRVVATAQAMDGRDAAARDVDVCDLVDQLMADFGWTEDEAEAALDEAEESGAVWFGKPLGTVLS